MVDSEGTRPEESGRESGAQMSSKKLVGVLVGLLVALLLAWLTEYRAQMKSINERLLLLQERTARSEEAEFYIKDTLKRIENKLD